MSREKKIVSDYADFEQLTKASFENLSSDEISYFVRDRFTEFLNCEWRKTATFSDLEGVFCRDSKYWGKLIQAGAFTQNFLKIMGKRRWKRFRDEVLLKLDYSRYTAIENINGLLDWRLPPSQVVAGKL